MLAATTLMQWVSLGVVSIGVVGMVIALRLQSRITRDGVIFLFAVGTLARGLIDARPDLIYAGIGLVSVPPTLRASIDKARGRDK